MFSWESITARNNAYAGYPIWLQKVYESKHHTLSQMYMWSLWFNQNTFLKEKKGKPLWDRTQQLLTKFKMHLFAFCPPNSIIRNLTNRYQEDVSIQVFTKKKGKL